MPKTDQPYQSVELVPYETRQRLSVPDSLSDAAKRHFVDLVTTTHSRHVHPSDIPLLSRWAELCAIAERAEFEMSRPNGLVTPDGKQTVWFGIHASATKSLNGLALRLRLGPQSRQPKQSKKVVESVSYYDEMRMSGDWDQP
jgi:hypothetical protein